MFHNLAVGTHNMGRITALRAFPWDIHHSGIFVYLCLSGKITEIGYGCGERCGLRLCNVNSYSHYTYTYTTKHPKVATLRN